MTAKPQSIKPMSDDDENIALILAHRSGDKRAMDRLVSRNIGFICKMAQKSGFMLLFEDRVAAGMVGMTKAAEKFDMDRGVKFLTYASHWIHNAIGREESDQGRLIRFPANVVQTMRKKENRENFEDLKEIESPVYLDAPSGNDMKISLMETVANPEEHEISDEANFIAQVVGKLKRPRERHVIRRRFGLDGEDPKSLEEIGLEMGLSKERIRQIQKSAMARLTEAAKWRKRFAP